MNSDTNELQTPKFLQSIDNLLLKIKLGDNWQKYFVFRITILLSFIAVLESSLLHIETFLNEFLTGIMGFFLWAFVLSYWRTTRMILKWWVVLLSIGIAAFLGELILKACQK
ncbi:MAG: hypothetical protein ABSC53_13685 [Bacteroidota bacterium]|jgi:hypothetical protein